MLYYLPHVTSVTPDVLEQHGVAYAFESKPRYAQVTRGPAGGPPGMIVCDARAPRADRLGLYADEQFWRRIPHADACVGYWLGELPQADQLARRSPLAGHPVQLADGRLWQCPAAIRWDSAEALPRAALPHAVDLDDDGHWITGAILPDYAQLWQCAERWQAFYASLSSHDSGESVEAELELSDVFDDAVACLAANYRVAKIEVVTLRLLTEAVAARVLDALIDMPGLQQILQKKTAD